LANPIVADERGRPVIIKRGLVFILLGAALLVMFLLPASEVSADGRNVVYVIPIEDMITVGTAGFLERHVLKAEEAGAQAVIVMMNTPGGLVDATLDINRIFRGTYLPVVVFVAPSGAIAASAGAFILISADVAAMAPGTTVGAAQPITLSPEGGTAPAEEKTERFLAGHIRSMAKETGRPEEIAEKFITENLVLNYEDAMELGVSDITAANLNELLLELDGYEVEKEGEALIMQTAGARLVDVRMNIGERLQNTLSNPQVAFLLLMLGLAGIYLGLNMPGTFVPEVLGGIILVMGIYGMGLFDISTTGIILLVVGVALIIAEIFTPGFGILGIGGIISLLFGSILLPIEPLMAPDWYHAFRATVIGVVVGVGILLLIVVQAVIGSWRRRKKEPRFFHMPEKAVVVEELSPGGLVSFQGEIWKARNLEKGVVEVGREVQVVNQEGLLLLVKAMDENEGGIF
jgi:membrane-bound serine protease (ClpP class)